jgi:hypothetical protein
MGLMNKKTFLAIAAILVLGGGGLAAKIAVDRPNDPQQFVNNALVNSLEIDSSKTKSSLKTTINLGEMGNGQATITASGQTNNATAYLPTVDYQIDLEGNLNLGEKIISVITSGEIKMIEEVIYGRLNNFTAQGVEDLNLPIEKIESIVKKWFGLSFEKLKKSDPEVAIVFEEQKEAQLQMRENLKNILTTKNLLLVKKMPICLKDLQPVEVVLNIELLTSDEFLTEMEKMFTPANLSNGEPNPFKLNEDKKAELREAIVEFTSKINSTITLQIDRNDGILRDYSTNLQVDLADFGLSGTANFALNAEISEINQPQIIEAPAEFEEIDPLQLIPASPTTFELEEEFELVEE